MTKWFNIWFGILLFISTSAYAQLPDNIGFEKGNFDGWECTIGKRTPAPGTVDVMDPGIAPVFLRHTIIGPESKGILDAYGHFPVLCPNGSNYSVLLGNAGAAGKMQRVSYKFKVPANVTTYTIIFNYAVVLENPLNHPLDQQPIFTAKIYDVTNDVQLACPSYEFTASGTLINDVGFQLSDITRTTNTAVYYKDWSTAMIDLSSYKGKDVRIEFTTEDCKPSGHFGYAYLDVDEILSTKPINGDVFCADETQTTLIGPTGFAEYKWYKNGDLSTAPLIGKNVTVPAVDGQKYTLEVTPYPNLGCPDFLDVVLKKFSEAFNLVVADKLYGCSDYGADLTALTVTAGSSSMKYFNYYKDPGGSEYLLNPKKVTVPGTYYIKGTNECGRTGIKPVQVIIIDPVINIVDHVNIQYPAKIDIAGMFTHQAGVIYNYFKDAGLTENTSSIVATSGTYYIKATNGNQCVTIGSIKVVVDPPPPYKIMAPNTFSPNGDGINDAFFVTIDGIASFKSLDIFNRYGQKVFSSKSSSGYWDGNEGAKQIPAGTYYWIFQGSDDYNHTKITKSGSVTIIR